MSSGSGESGTGFGVALLFTGIGGVMVFSALKGISVTDVLAGKTGSTLSPAGHAATAATPTGGGGGTTLNDAGQLVSANTAGGLQLPERLVGQYAPTHQTAGLPGYPANDVMGDPGKPVLSPADGVVSKLSGRDPKYGAWLGPGGPFGWSIYIKGDNGLTYYLTHFGSVSVKRNQRVKRGQVIGTIGDYPGSVPDHIHEGVSG